MGTTLERQMAHKKLFDQFDTRAGPARGVLGLDQFVEWAFDHVISKIGKVPAKDVGLYQVQDYSEEEYIGFVERDEQCEGRITYDQFDKLLTRAAVVPRHFGLAPPESSTEARKKMFDQLELVRGDKKSGFVTARTFWEWTVVH